jgi:DNA-binding beta-propeller fold protein YncE
MRNLKLPSVSLALTMTMTMTALPWATSIARAQGGGQYTIVRTVPLGAPDRWDYVVADAAAHRVYVSHGDRVTVVDGRDGTIVGQISGFPGGTHGIAIATAAGRGYTDDGRAGMAASFDLKTLQVGKQLKADDDADAVAFDPVSGHVFVVDGDPGRLTVIDPKSDSVIGSPLLGSKLEYAVAGGNGKLYVNSVEKHEIVRLDTATNQVDAHWPMPACERPHGLAIDAVTHLLFSGCANSTLTVVNAQSGEVVANVPIGRGSDGVAFDPRRKLILSANGQDGSLSVIHEDGATAFSTLATIHTAVSARTLAIDTETGRLYLAAADVDPNPATAAPAPAAAAAASAGAPPPATAPARPRFIPGSLKLLFMDPQP